MVTQSKYPWDYCDRDAADLVMAIKDGANAPETYLGVHVLLSAMLRLRDSPVVALKPAGSWSKQMLDAFFEETK